MPSTDTNILEFDQYQKSDETPPIIYADLKSLIKWIDECKKNCQNHSQLWVFNVHGIDIWWCRK